MCRLSRLFKEQPQPLEPPQALGRISAIELRGLLQVFFPGAHISLGDYDYELMSCDDCRRFLKWYHDKHPYTWDEYDCEVFAWVMRAEALKWMHGKFVFGYIEAEGFDDNYSFQKHGFCFLIDYRRNAFFCDELCVAGPADNLEPFYSVKAYEVKA